MLRSRYSLFAKVLGGAGVVFLSFFITLYFLRQWSASDDAVTRLQRLTIHGPAELEKMAPAAGLKKSDQITGTIEGVAREADGRLKVVGWIASGGGGPVWLVVFVDGSAVLTIRARGGRDDVQRFLQGRNFPTESWKDVRIEELSEQSIPCSRMNKIFMVGIDQNGKFNALGGAPPKGC
jgi:hypothetical protein